MARLLLQALLASALLLAPGAAGALGAAPGRSDGALLSALNQARLRHGMQPLVVDPKLEATARAHTLWMLHTGSFSHGNFAWRLLHSGARGPTFGENLAWGSGARAQAPAIVASWLASPEHRANMLRPGYRRIGLGALTGRFAGTTALVVTADFAGD